MSYVSSLPSPRLLCSAAAKLANEQLLRSSLHTRHHVTFDHSHLEPSTIGAADFFLRARRECACAMRCAAYSSLIQTHTCTHSHSLAGSLSCFSAHLKWQQLQTRREQKATYDSCQEELSVAHQLLCCKPKHCEIQVFSIFTLFLYFHVLSFLSLHGHYFHN